MHTNHQELPSTNASSTTTLAENPYGSHSRDISVDDVHKAEAIPSNSLDKAPDGGLIAWTQATMAHLVVFNTRGFANSFGIFQAYYKGYLGRSRADIAWIGSIQIFLIFMIGTFSGRAIDAGYYRTILVAGLFLQILEVFMTSVAQEYWQIFLAQGVCQGIGNGLIYTPTVSLVSTYFSKRRAMAMAITSGGGATGGIVFPLVAQQLLPKSCPRKSGPIVEWSAFRELPYLLFSIGSFLILWAVYLAYSYISTFSHDIIGISSSTSLTILLITNAVGIPGRAILAFVADRYTGLLSMYIPMSLAAGISLYAWSAVRDLSGLVVFSVMYGLFAAACQGLFIASCSSLTVDLSKMGTRTGMVFTIVSFATLTGPPLAGMLIEKRNGDYLYVQFFGGTSFVLGSLILIGARSAHTGTNWKCRV
ncbi:hypothetical protein H112_05263 [Trichophyton rubrum D6]|uniref:Major facilitator superfamily (MFS) profile domain-containing protein n=2 Tax=Trichophyton rubrum TaxID=5551 RepID=F2SM53_TRIRC|nr:uncharacterized protein TERG_03012 [Trichophyton rubrum CBS 118892]EZF20228.1 hypothetical protein H100_05285 [Trichophyton rubrum MR850]EZF40792.1 hypothetical protein H102_05275 [Trichophyton rubrum CBS 100081]EZF51409.1 hypothetical protein H103_05276 [Trichophyton rubrum CBS 288.86]EZF62090.1 hypothetical protein H104_05266 [Trichophyton rubrum CBS 289.86]EZF83463.1 hypothetical protein H110_05273 [Trichophyton rubrum MR1448]EZF94119.1 hypothetical protein H113_05313 [Trichophyton rubr